MDLYLVMFGVLLLLRPSSTGGQKIGDVTVIRFTNSKSGGGRLEILLQQFGWLPFCTSGFNSRAAYMSCRKMGYLYAANYGTIVELGYSNKRSILLNCSENAIHIEACSYSLTYECASEAIVALECTNSSNQIVAATSINSLTSYNTAEVNSTATINVEKSFVRVSVALGFSLLAFFVGSLVLVTASIIIWRRRHSHQTEQGLLSNDELSSTLNRNPNIYVPPPKYSQIDAE